MTKVRVGLGCALLAVLAASGRAQVSDTPADPAQQRAARTFAVKPVPSKAPAVSKVLTPLTPRERVLQLLDRFTYGPRPGEVDRVLAIGEDKWLAQQMAPDSVPDAACAKRLAAYATLSMPAAQAIFVFPNQSLLDGIVAGKAPYPDDPVLKGMLEVQVDKVRKAQAAAKTLADAPTDAQKAADRKAYLAAVQGQAERVAGDLLALPRSERLAALLEAAHGGPQISFTYNGTLAGTDAARRWCLASASHCARVGDVEGNGPAQGQSGVLCCRDEMARGPGVAGHPE